MITHATVLVLGAGASKPYGMPLGSELRDAVLRSCRQDLVRFNLGGGDVSGFVSDLMTSGRRSVDAFLEQRPEWVEIGKAAMAVRLMDAEFQCCAQMFPPSQPADHWLETLFGLMEAPTWEEFRAQDLRVVTFNYDRLVEHYLCAVIANRYYVGSAEVEAWLPVIHVHGSLGVYVASEFCLHPLEFATQESVLSNARSLQIVHESSAEHDSVKLARSALKRAECVLFLGVGYHKANMVRLGFEPGKLGSPSAARVVGTRRGIPGKRWASMCSEYQFSPEASEMNVGSISDMLIDCVESS